MPGEGYRFGDSIYVFVVEVRNSMRGPSITVSRTHPGLVRQLFMLEVPEISDGIVELKNVAREAGQRTKIAVAANNPDVDPVGACVGPRGMRVGKVVAELGNEKVDIVRWNTDAILYISNALSPAQISKVILTEDDGSSGTAGTATVIVAEDQQSLAIGKQGQNVRLAAKLTGWRIDIRTEKQYAEEQAKRMFSLDAEATPTKPLAVRESADELAGLFSPDILTADNGHESGVSIGSTLTDAELGLDMGGSAPPADVEHAGIFDIGEASATNGTAEAGSPEATRAEEAGSVTGGVSSVAPGDAGA